MDASENHVFVTWLPANATRACLLERFGVFGKVLDAKFVSSPTNSLGKRAVVSFATAEQAAAAVSGLDGKLFNRQCIVRVTRMQELPKPELAAASRVVPKRAPKNHPRGSGHQRPTVVHSVLNSRLSRKTDRMWSSVENFRAKQLPSFAVPATVTQPHPSHALLPHASTRSFSACSLRPASVCSLRSVSALSTVSPLISTVLSLEDSRSVDYRSVRLSQERSPPTGAHHPYDLAAHRTLAVESRTRRTSSFSSP
eukprot:gnl/Hemi2/19625_TR6509_c0_g1_i1.p1 gnl/Hemi2/19625_TR6509_c0_g1~~gnl/Hemi2/19625_TR6509_c0_g1_i1.p1  ORF type:complete len:254 (+),score=48.94 gnl/Hemi2/19625_TR6509_c0_g1_i1:80-841(+)